jgi:hypothetical protein
MIADLLGAVIEEDADGYVCIHYFTHGMPDKVYQTFTDTIALHGGDVRDNILRDDQDPTDEWTPDQFAAAGAMMRNDVSFGENTDEDTATGEGMPEFEPEEKADATYPESGIM